MNMTRSQKISNPGDFIRNISIAPGLIFGIIITTALLFFELFNYSTTDFALRDLLGNLRFAGIRWSTTLSIAFCAIDFAGIARLFTPEKGRDEPKEVWYLLGAWLLAATMNAVLTWWGVSMAIVNHNVEAANVVDPKTILHVVPVFVAVMVWIIRVLIIGSISVAGDRIFWHNGRTTGSTSRRSSSTVRTNHTQPSTVASARTTTPRTSYSNAMPRSSTFNNQPQNTYAEPSYHSLSVSANASKGEDEHKYNRSSSR